MLRSLRTIMESLSLYGFGSATTTGTSVGSGARPVLALTNDAVLCVGIWVCTPFCVLVRKPDEEFEFPDECEDDDLAAHAMFQHNTR